MRLILPVLLSLLLVACTAVIPGTSETVGAGRSAALLDSRESCATAAAHPNDPVYGKRLGVPWDNLDIAAARSACDSALQRYPRDLYAAFHLSRALRKQGDKRWQALLQHAADGGLPIAAAVIGGDMSGADWDDERGDWGYDYRRARVYLIAAINGGVATSVGDLVSIVAFGVDGGLPDATAGEQLADLWAQSDPTAGANSKAWIRALHGRNLDAALETTRRSIAHVETARAPDRADRLATLYDTLARALMALGRWDEAIAAEHKAMEFAKTSDRQDVCAGIQLGLIQRRGGRAEESAVTWAAAKPLFGEPRRHRATLGVCPEFFHGPFAIDWQ